MPGWLVQVARTLDVASSRTRMRVRCSSALAIHSSCRCPVLMLLPPSTTGASRPPCVASHLLQTSTLISTPILSLTLTLSRIC